LESIQRGEVSEINETDSEMYALRPIRNLSHARGFRSVLLVPLKGEREIIGAISVTRVAPGTFITEHVELLKTVFLSRQSRCGWNSKQK
jgi:GAF domain-containing protein